MKDSEKDLEDYLVREVAKRGGVAKRLVDETRVGFPDRTVLSDPGRVTFVELKTPLGKLSSQQRQTIAELRSIGFSVEIPRSREDVDRLIRRHFAK